jgi:hypothetical protein
MRKPAAATKPVHRNPARSGNQRVNDDIASTIRKLEQIKNRSSTAAPVVDLLKSWLQDDSGYDEETWPRLKEALNRERDRVGARRLLDG